MKNVSKPVSSEKMISYLRSMLEDFTEEANKFGMEDRIVIKKFDAMIACKEMVEAMIGMPVNIQIDGKITIG